MGRCVLFLVVDSVCFKFWQLHNLPPPSAIKMMSSCTLGILQHVIDEHMHGGQMTPQQNQSIYVAATTNTINDIMLPSC